MSLLHFGNSSCLSPLPFHDPAHVLLQHYTVLGKDGAKHDQKANRNGIEAVNANTTMPQELGYSATPTSFYNDENGEIMITVNIGSLALPVSPLLVLISVIIGFTVSSLVAKKGDTENKEKASNALMLILLAGCVIGRLVFVLRFADSYDSVWQMFDIRYRGIDYTAALFSFVVVLFLQLRQRHLRKASLSGVLTMAGLYVVFSLVISAGREQSVLPHSSFMQLDGQTVTLPEISQQQPTVVNLWATWCPPCRREMPVLQQAEQRHNDVKFILLNQREPIHTVEHFLQQKGLSFKHVLLDSKGDMATSMGAFGLPVTLYFDANGQLVHSHMGELSAASLQQSIEQYF